MSILTEINDIRVQRDFAGKSFSEFKKTDVIRELTKSLLDNKLEPACFWSSELICAGHYMDLWNTIILFVGRYIYIGNPKIISYLELRITKFKEIVRNGYVGNELSMRNNLNIRKLFCEIVCVLCESSRKHALELIKITPNDFDITQLSERFKAPHTNYSKDIFKSGDPKQLFIAVNELAYHLSKESKDGVSASYWVEWILECTQNSKKQKQPYKCERRSMPVDSKDQLESVWIIWEMLMYYANKDGTLCKKTMESLLQVFCLRFTTGVIKRRRYLIYFGICLITESVNYKVNVIRNIEKIESVINKIDNIYKQIKKNEHAPETDYLFHNVKEKSNLEKTIAKLELMKQLT